MLFLPDGMPKTYTLMSDPTQYTTGGIGLYWWNGWLLGDRRIPGNAQHALLENLVKPRLQAAIVPPANSYWSPNDRWLVVDDDGDCYCCCCCRRRFFHRDGAQPWAW